MDPGLAVRVRPGLRSVVGTSRESVQRSAAGAERRAVAQWAKSDRAAAKVKHRISTSLTAQRVSVTRDEGQCPGRRARPRSSSRSASWRWRRSVARIAGSRAASPGRRPRAGRTRTRRPRRPASSRSAGRGSRQPRPRCRRAACGSSSRGARRCDRRPARRRRRSAPRAASPCSVRRRRSPRRARSGRSTRRWGPHRPGRWARRRSRRWSVGPEAVRRRDCAADAGVRAAEGEVRQRVAERAPFEVAGGVERPHRWVSGAADDSPAPRRRGELRGALRLRLDGAGPVGRREGVPLCARGHGAGCLAHHEHPGPLEGDGPEGRSRARKPGTRLTHLPQPRSAAAQARVEVRRPSGLRPLRRLVG